MFSWQQQVSLYKYSFLDNKCHRNCLLISIWACCNPKSYSPDVDIPELFQHCPESHMYELGVRRFEQCWKRNKSTSWFFSTCLVYKLILKDKAVQEQTAESSSATSLQFYLADLKILFSKCFLGQEILKINQKLFYKNKTKNWICFINEFKKCYYASVDKIVKGGVFTIINRNYKNKLYFFFICLQVESILRILYLI